MLFDLNDLLKTLDAITRIDEILQIKSISNALDFSCDCFWVEFLVNVQDIGDNQTVISMNQRD